MKSEKLCPRFVREYAAYVIRRANCIENLACRRSYARRVNHIVAQCERGYITPAEAVECIAGEAIY